MSDGNYNRSLLPHTPYESGLRMGRAIARRQALEAFRRYIRQANPSLTNEEEDCQADVFLSLLNK
ncbi:MAG: hypothetical protein LUC86_04515 [Prevotellaceae bacterium]|nr:hypothetical protein [Prevotellaceae bacterium]MCD8304071.1 hypothetical protein [Prevotellaceae bacterium]